MRGLQGRAESGACLRVGAKWGLPPDQSLTLSPTLNLLSSSFSSSSHSFLIPFSFFSSLFHPSHPPSRVYHSLTQASTYSTLPHLLLHFSSFHSFSTPHKGEGMWSRACSLIPWPVSKPQPALVLGGSLPTLVLGGFPLPIFLLLFNSHPSHLLLHLFSWLAHISSNP